MKHPDEGRIASFACGDAGWLERVSVGRHVARCARCRAVADAFREDRAAIRGEAFEMPPGVDWMRLSAEMAANIRVGLEAGECVPALASARERRPVAWRPVFATAGLTAVVLSALYLNFPAEQRQSLARGVGRLWHAPAATVAQESGVALAATRNGIEVRENGSAMTMVSPGDGPSVVVVNTGGSLRARYIDGDTGQVTITNVYAQ